MITSICNKITKIFLWCVIKCAVIFIKFPIAAISMCKKKEKCTEVKDGILFLSATTLAEKIRNKSLKSETIVNAYIARIIEVNPLLNAIIEHRFKKAVEEARAIDERIEKASKPDELLWQYPLLGVPITVKGSIAVSGLLHCAGRYFTAPEDRVAHYDADVVRQVKNAGAIILLISSTPEMCYNIECYNNVIGTTVNPYDRRKTSGGSSGGEGALLGAGASIIGLGSDIAGSLRLPAFYCGVYGHKPTAGIISTNGHFPGCADKESWDKFFTFGPMTRYAEDISLILQIIAKPEKVHLLRLTENVNASSIKIFYMLNDGGSLLTNKISEDILNLMNKTIINLKDKVGCDIENVIIPELKNSVAIGFMSLLKINDIEHCLDNDKKSALFELLKTTFGCSKHNTTSVLYILLKRLFNKFVSEQRNNLMEDSRINLKQKMEEILGDNGVLIYPTFPSTAGFHKYVYSNVFDAAYLAIFNALGFPVTNCPLGLSPDGMPIGMQIVAASNNDRLCISIAKEIENIVGKWKSP